MTKIVHQTPPGFKRVILGKRIAYAPSPGVRATHERFLRQAHAVCRLHFTEPGQEIVNHLNRGHRFFFSTDLESAFDQVTFDRLCEVLPGRGINPEWLVPIEYFFHKNGSGGLIQGAPSSPYLFEIYCRYVGLDRALFEYCDKLGFRYSRYVDDILISSSHVLGRRIGPKVRQFVEVYGFTLNGGKTKKVDVHNEPLEVLGFVVRGTRVDPSDSVMESLHDLRLSDATRKGLFGWRRRVRKLSKRVAHA